MSTNKKIGKIINKCEEKHLFSSPMFCFLFFVVLPRNQNLLIMYPSSIKYIKFPSLNYEGA